MIRAKRHVLATAALMAGLLLAAGPRAEARGKKRTWKPVMAALLKFNNHAVKTWNVLRADKDHNLLLVQVNRDWYAFNLKKKRLYRVNRRDYKSHGQDLVGPEPDKRTPEIRTNGWDSHDVGPAQQITVQMAESGNVISIELPHPLANY